MLLNSLNSLSPKALSTLSLIAIKFTSLTTMYNNFEYAKNALIHLFSNGQLEDKNNLIKVLTYYIYNMYKI